MLPNDEKTTGGFLTFIKNAENTAPLLCVIVMVLMLLSGLLMPVIFPDIASSYLFISTYLIAFLAPCIIFGVTQRKKAIFNFSAPAKGTLKFTFSAIFLLVGAAILTKCITAYVTGSGMSQTSALLSDAGLFESLLCYTLLPAVLEEIAFRGIAFSVYQKSCGGIGAIFATSVFFAMAHFSGEEFLSYFVSGIILGTVVYITRSVFTVIILHFVNNTVSFFLENAVFKVASEVKSGILAIFLVTAFTLVALFWFLSELEAVCKRRYLAAPNDTAENTTGISEWFPTLLPLDGDIVTAALRMALSPLFLGGIIIFAVFIAVI